MGVPVDLDAVRYREAEAEGKRAPAARAAAQLHEDALFETPKNTEVRPAPPVSAKEKSSAAVQRVQTAHAAYERDMSK